MILQILSQLVLFIIQLLGIGFHIMQKIRKLRTLYPTFGLKDMFKVFFGQEWDSLIVSGLVVAVYQLVFIVLYLTDAKTPQWWPLASYGLAFVLGYAGQRLAYKYLGTAEQFLSDNADRLIGNQEKKKEEGNNQTA